jgi:hypothetical protein
VLVASSSLRLAAAQIQPGEIAAMTPDEYAQAFMAYIAGLLADFDRYLAAGPPDPVRDGAVYQVAAMWLTDTEFADFLRDLRTIATPRLANAPGKGRRRRMLYSVLLPAPEQQASDNGPRRRTRRPKTQDAKDS